MTKFIWLRCQLLVFSPVTRVDLQWLMAFLGWGFMTTEFFWTICVEADKESSGKVSPAFAVFQAKSGLQLTILCLQFKIINIPKQHILGGWLVLNSCGHILVAYSAALQSLSYIHTSTHHFYYIGQYGVELETQETK